MKIYYPVVIPDQIIDGAGTLLKEGDVSKLSPAQNLEAKSVLRKLGVHSERNRIWRFVMEVDTDTKQSRIIPDIPR